MYSIQHDGECIETAEYVETLGAGEISSYESQYLEGSEISMEVKANERCADSTTTNISDGSGSIVSLSGASDIKCYSYWPDSEVLRFLKIYIKHVKTQPLLNGKADHAMWAAIHNEFDAKKHFTLPQIQSKLVRLKHTVKEIMKSESTIDVNLPIYQLTRNILEMDEDRHTINKKKCIFTTDELLKLINAYQKIAPIFKRKTGSIYKMRMWAQIAKSIQKPRIAVQKRFMLLQRHWQRWKKSGKEESNRLYDVLVAFDAVMSDNIDVKQKICRRSSSNSEDNNVIKKVRCKWSRERTVSLLKNYKSQLEKLSVSDDVVTRKQVYHQIGRLMNIPEEAVEAKLRHLKMASENQSNYKKWTHQPTLNAVIKLENSIWGSSYPSISRSSEPSEHQDITANVDSDEPTWFKEYRREVENRHKDRVNVLNKLLNVMQALVSKHK